MTPTVGETGVIGKASADMTIEEAVAAVARHFPFAGYMTPSGELKPAYASVASTVLKYLPHGGRILDFGSGPCDKAAVLRALGFDCHACDDLQDEWHTLASNRELIRSFAQRMGVPFSLLTSQALPYGRNEFDMVMLHDVLEHLHDSPRELLNDLVELLKPGGLLFVTVPNAVNVRKRVSVLTGRTNLPEFEYFYWYPGRWRGHVREYVRGDLTQLCQYLGLNVVVLKGCDHGINRLPKATRPLYRMVTGLLPDWKDTWLLVASKPKDWSSHKETDAVLQRRILGTQSSYNYSEPD